MTEHQKAIQDKFRKITESSRMIASYEAEIKLEEQKAELSDSVSKKEHQKRAKELRTLMKGYQNDVEKAKKMIETLPEGLGKRILSMRYLQLMKMEDIAVILSYDRTYLYTLYYKALNDIQQN